MTRFFLIRHATTDAVGKHLSGRMKGVHLNEEGRLQAANLAERLQHVTFQAVYSSPLERAIETAEALSKLKNIKTIINENFLELDFGDWTNKTFEELEGEHAFNQFNKLRSCTRIPGGELMLEGQARFIKGIEALYKTHPGQNIAIISHSDMIKSAIAYYAGVHLDLFHRIEISPASVSVVELYEDTARIMLVNHSGEINF
jgi:probable phosphomutase (TIGR03848 family)